MSTATPRFCGCCATCLDQLADFFNRPFSLCGGPNEGLCRVEQLLHQRACRILHTTIFSLKWSPRYGTDRMRRWPDSNEHGSNHAKQTDSNALSVGLGLAKQIMIEKKFIRECPSLARLTLLALGPPWRRLIVGFRADRTAWGCCSSIMCSSDLPGPQSP